MISEVMTYSLCTRVKSQKHTCVLGAASWSCCPRQRSRRCRRRETSHAWRGEEAPDISKIIYNFFEFWLCLTVQSAAQSHSHPGLLVLPVVPPVPGLGDQQGDHVTLEEAEQGAVVPGCVGEDGLDPGPAVLLQPRCHGAGPGQGAGLRWITGGGRALSLPFSNKQCITWCVATVAAYTPVSESLFFKCPPCPISIFTSNIPFSFLISHVLLTLDYFLLKLHRLGDTQVDVFQ